MKDKVKNVLTYKKGAMYNIDQVESVMRIISEYIRKPDEREENELHKRQIGHMSDYDIFEKNVKITIEIFD